MKKQLIKDAAFQVITFLSLVLFFTNTFTDFQTIIILAMLVVYFICKSCYYRYLTIATNHKLLSNIFKRKI